jgi:post-segregation antitoxin (ccd killing protein)
LSPAGLRVRLTAATEAIVDDGTKIRVEVELDKDLVELAAGAGLDLNEVAGQALQRALRDRRWQAEHADVIAWYNEHIERDGIFGEEWRTF